MRPCSFFLTFTLALSAYAHTGNLQNHQALTVPSITGGNGNTLNTNNLAKHGIGQRLNKKPGFAGHGSKNRKVHRVCRGRGGKSIKRGTGQRGTGQRKTPGAAFAGSNGHLNRAAHRACHRRGGKLVPHGTGRRQGGKLVARADSDDEDAMSCVTDADSTRYYSDFTDLEDGVWNDPGTDVESCIDSDNYQESDYGEDFNYDQDSDDEW